MAFNNNNNMVVVPLLLVCLTFLSSQYVASAYETMPGRHKNRPPIQLPPLMTMDIAVEGIVYCRSCKLPLYDKTIGASPLPGAIAMLQCERGQSPLYTKSDDKGYFLFITKASGNHKCEVKVWSPFEWCDQLVYSSGGSLMFKEIVHMGKTTVAVFSAGAFAFSPAHVSMCPHHV